MYSRKSLLAIIVSFLIASGLIVGAWLSQQPSIPFISPAAPRPWAHSHWLQKTSAPQPSPLLPDRLHQISVEKEGYQFALTTPSLERNEVLYQPPMRVIRADAQHQFPELGEGVCLSTIGVAYYDHRPTTKEIRPIPASFYHPDLTPVTPSELDALIPDKRVRKLRTSDYPDSPAICIQYALPTLRNVTYLDSTLFDARTHVAIGQHNAYGNYDSKTQSMRIAENLHLWHPCPIEQVLDIAHGEWKSTTFPAQEGERFQLGPTRGKVLFVGEGLWRLDRDSDPQHPDFDQSIFRFYPNRRLISFTETDNAPITTIQIALHQRYPALRFEALDAEGNVIGGRPHRDYHFQTLTLHFRAPREDIVAIRLKRPSHYSRLIVHLDEFPGLPSQNRNLTNLADLTIPYLKARQSSRFGDTIQHLGQLSSYGAVAPFAYAERASVEGNIRESVEYENITLGELLQEHLTHYPPGTKIYIHPDDHSILYYKPLTLLEQCKLFCTEQWNRWF